jgi:hypothetical protein
MAGVGPGSTPEAPGQLVRHWVRDRDTVVEIRWPATPAPAGATPTGTIADGAFPVELWPEVATDGAARIVATVQVGDDAADPCAFVSVEGYAPRPDPIADELLTFVTSLQPLDARSAFLAALVAEQAPAPGSDRPPGACADPVPATVGEDGSPDTTSARLLAERFLADRVAGNAAEDCLTVSGARAFRDGEPEGTLPGLCLTECGDTTVVAGEVVAESGGDGRVELLVLYEEGDVVRRFREFLEVNAVDDGAGGHAALINDARIGPESEIAEATAHLVIEDLLDAVAAGEYQIAAGYLLNEGISAEVEERLGNLWEVPPGELFASFCATAACGAPFEIGDTVAVDPYARTLSVTFSTTAGPVTVPITATVFEGRVTAASLPPVGAPAGTADPIDVRVFGEPYPGTLLAGRAQAVEHIARGVHRWEVASQLPLATALDAAGDVMVVSFMDVVAVAGGDGAPGSELATAPFTLAGAGAAHRYSLALVSDGERLDAIDLVSGRRATVLDHAGGDGTIESADVAGDTLLVTLGDGARVWYEVYAFDAGALAVDPDGRSLAPDEPVSAGHLSPDGTHLATAQPTGAVAVLDSTTGAVLDRWSLGEGETVTDLDYDGRWILARLDGRTLLVVDTDTGETRRVDTAVRLRFG